MSEPGTSPPTVVGLLAPGPLTPETPAPVVMGVGTVESVGVAELGPTAESSAVSEPEPGVVVALLSVVADVEVTVRVVVVVVVGVIVAVTVLVLVRVLVNVVVLVKERTVVTVIVSETVEVCRFARLVVVTETGGEGAAERDEVTSDGTAADGSKGALGVVSAEGSDSVEVEESVAAGSETGTGSADTADASDTDATLTVIGGATDGAFVAATDGVAFEGRTLEDEGTPGTPVGVGMGMETSGFVGMAAASR